MAEPPDSALAGLYRPGFYGRAAPSGPGVHLTERRGWALVQIAAWDGRGDALREHLAEALGVEVPDRPNLAAMGADTTVLWAGPGRWLVLRERTEPAALTATAVEAAADTSAAVVDVSGGRSLIRLRGPETRRILATGTGCDTQAGAFRPGEVRLTTLGHVAAVVHLVDDAPTADVLIARSVAVSVWAWLAEAARPYGYTVGEPIG